MDDKDKECGRKSSSFGPNNLSIGSFLHYVKRFCDYNVIFFFYLKRRIVTLCVSLMRG